MYVYMYVFVFLPTFSSGLGGGTIAIAAKIDNIDW